MLIFVGAVNTDRVSRLERPLLCFAPRVRISQGKCEGTATGEKYGEWDEARRLPEPHHPGKAKAVGEGSCLEKGKPYLPLSLGICNWSQLYHRYAPACSGGSADSSLGDAQHTSRVQRGFEGNKGLYCQDLGLVFLGVTDTGS